ncbi:unnamed protein product [Miscanthus lutarioriparius]|uniref:PGG domain-containing protein n=1 Tax=Miscanthus lutarioriparius TaxID=422564 RepID=A0A811S5W9_9POAL|nr:unnamed protein product [Miscanthus lutarioriparius]
MALASNNKVASSLSPMASGGAQSHSHSPPVAGVVADEALGSNNNKPAASKPPSGSSTEYQLRKYLLLLATLVATVTYVAGLNLPGGAWQEDTDDGRHHAGDPILQYAHLHRYLTFYYCNATAFAASLVVSLLLLVLDGKNTGWEALLRVVMVLDLLGLMGAYAAGSCRDKFTTIYSALLVCAVFAYIVVAFIFYLFSSDGGGLAILLHSRKRLTGAADAEKQAGGVSVTATSERQELHEVLMLLATFAVAITYVAGLNPPGGFWGDTKDGHQMSDPVLQEHYSSRYQAFYVCNTTAFVASLLIIILLLDKKLTTKLSVRFVALYGLIITALLGLMGAYAAGSCRELDDTTYVICLIAGVLAYIFLQVAVAGCSCFRTVYGSASKWLGALRSRCGFDRSSQGQNPPDQQNQISSRSQDQNKTDQIQISSRDIHQVQDQGSDAVVKEKALEKERLEKARSLVMLLATLVVSITYSAGLDPPGGLWPDTRDGHRNGDPILLTTHPTRYKVFFYSNSAAFVASLIVILMVQSRFLLKGHTLEAAMILDLFGLISAYAAGSCRDETTSIYVVALAGIVLVYVVIHIVLFTLDHKDNHPDLEKKLENRREVLLLLAILAATLTYQAGLTPPGGFWSKNEDGHRAGYPVLHDHYRPRYMAFFYCNAASFMASVALIVLLVNPNLYKPGIRCYALYVCMVVGMFGLMGAYAAGSSRDLRTSIYVLTLVVAVFAFVALEVVIFWVCPYLRDHWNQWWRCSNDAAAADSSGQAAEPDDGTKQKNQVTEIQESKTQGEMQGGGEKNMREYLMLLGVLAASVTYQTGLKPPGGMWQDNSDGHSAGSSILHYINKPRYHAFFYSNSTSFMASVVVIILLMPETLHKYRLPLGPMHTAILLDMLGLLGAYAAGSTRDWETSRNVIYLVIPVLAYIAAYAAVSIFRKKRWCQCSGSRTNS